LANGGLDVPAKIFTINYDDLLADLNRAASAKTIPKKRKPPFRGGYFLIAKL